MKFLITAIFLFATLISFSSNDISYFRKEFIGTTDAEKAKTYLDAEIEKSDLNDKITINGYKAVVTMRMAQYVINPLTKLGWFREGKKMLEKSIKMNRNVENIHLRLMVQINAPSFLNYNKEIERDTKYIIKNLDKSSIPESAKKRVLVNLLANDKSGRFIELAKKYGVE